MGKPRRLGNESGSTSLTAQVDVHGSQPERGLPVSGVTRAAGDRAMGASAPRGTQLTTHIVANVDFVELVVPLDVRSDWQPGTALMWNT